MLVYICTYARGYIHTQHTRSTHNEARHTRHITYVHTQASQHALANTQTKHTHRKRAQLHGILLVPWHLTSSTPKRLHAEADQRLLLSDPTPQSDKQPHQHQIFSGHKPAEPLDQDIH